MATETPSNPMDEETRLVRRCLAGDADAFKQMYDAHAKRLYNLAYRMTGTAAEAEDVLQDVFMQAFRKLSTFKGESSLGTWLYRLGVNLCLDRARSKQGRMDRSSVALEDDRDHESHAVSEGRRLNGVERIDLERAIEQLPASYKAAFLLHDVEGFEHGEVGRMLGIAEGTSKSLVHKARLRLRTLLSATVTHPDSTTATGAQRTAGLS